MKTCQFCSKDTVYVPLRVSEKHVFHIYWCYDCNTEYVDPASVTGIASTHVYTTIGQRMYRWTFQNTKDGPVSFLWHVGKPGIPGVEPNRDLKLVKYFKPHFQQITPQNVERKIRFILVFL